MLLQGKIMVLVPLYFNKNLQQQQQQQQQPTPTTPTTPSSSAGSAISTPAGTALDTKDDDDGDDHPSTIILAQSHDQFVMNQVRKESLSPLFSIFLSSLLISPTCTSTLIS